MGDVPCGNTVGLVGVDQFILKSGTLSTIETAHNIAPMKYSVAPVVKVAVKPKDGKDLRDDYAQCDFVQTDPIVSYRETVGALSSQICLAKSPNKHNRLYIQAEPLQEEISADIEQGCLGPKADQKERNKR